jgi:hypothetical protein
MINQFMMAWPFEEWFLMINQFMMAWPFEEWIVPNDQSVHDGMAI